MSWLKEVAKHHKEWIKIAQVYGARDYAEDCVQQAYLKLNRYGSPDKIFCEHGNLTKQGRGYMFWTIKTVVMQYHKDEVIMGEELPEVEDTHENNEDRVQGLWFKIDAYTSREYPLYKRILYKMWRKNYTIREMADLTEVSVPTIVKELKLIKKDINQKFKNEYNETQR